MKSLTKALKIHPNRLHESKGLCFNFDAYSTEELSENDLKDLMNKIQSC